MSTIFCIVSWSSCFGQFRWSRCWLTLNLIYLRIVLLHYFIMTYIVTAQNLVNFGCLEAVKNTVKVWLNFDLDLFKSNAISVIPLFHWPLQEAVKGVLWWHFHIYFKFEPFQSCLLEIPRVVLVMQSGGLIEMMCSSYSVSPQSGYSEKRSPRYRGQHLPSQILHLCTSQPLKSGRPANQNTFSAPRRLD